MKIKVTSNCPFNWYKVGEIYEVTEGMLVYNVDNKRTIMKEHAEIIEEPKFNEGDIVECVDNSGYGRYLEINKRYTVTKVKHISRYDYIELKGLVGDSRVERFVLAKPQFITEVIKTSKYLLLNVTSQKTVGIMKYTSAMNCCDATPNCEFQLIELGTIHEVQREPVVVTECQSFVEVLNG
jgi:hypothetical protein